MLIKPGIVATLLQLLFSMKSVLMTLREPTSVILAQIAAQSKVGIVLVKQDVAQQMISLHLTNPVIQYSHLLKALNAIATCSNASKGGKLMEQLEEMHLHTLSSSFTTDDEKAATVGILSNFPVSDKNVKSFS
ncbi:hypothetical protein RDI58_024224 [Solanum bulbocastanum]|uniref:Uncharacterized protein n=1 Tax=Solanum bulbocastanum TaxID=147425 RepID=A0AAN8Y396_SOLBU